MSIQVIIDAISLHRRFELLELPQEGQILARILRTGGDACSASFENLS